MPRPPRADEAGGIYHALNRGNARSVIFHKEEDYDAFERILSEGLDRYEVELFSFQLMPNHWHLLLRSGQDGAMSQFMRWITATHTMRYHAHYHTSGEGHVYQGRFKSFPVQDDDHFLTVARYIERNALSANLTERAEDWRWGSLFRWKSKPEPEPRLLSTWPIRRSPGWAEKVNQALTKPELDALRRSSKRGSPFGNEQWVTEQVNRLGLESTIRQRGRPRVRKR